MVGKVINTEIKKHLEEAKIVCGLITHNSIHSEYVLFELGAGWAQDKAIAILGPDASITPADIPAPLRGNTCIRISEKTGLYKLIDYICTKSGVNPEPRDVLEDEISKFLDNIVKIELTKLHKSEKIHPVPGRTYLPVEFNKVWPQTMFIRDKFFSISLMHPKLWTIDAAIMGIYTLGGAKHAYSDAVIKRIFVVYEPDELQLLESTLRLHLQMNLRIRYITLENYNNLCKQSCTIITYAKGTSEYCIPAESFTIANLNYSNDFQNDLCLISYKISPEERLVSKFTTVEQNSADKVHAYENFFRAAWDQSKEITQGNIDKLMSINALLTIQ